MSDFTNYMLQQEKRKHAYANYNHASQTLQNAWINERLAELKGQPEPLASLLSKPMTERDRLYAAAFYVVTGRLPEESE
jgi:hypothetical protein